MYFSISIKVFYGDENSQHAADCTIVMEEDHFSAQNADNGEIEQVETLRGAFQEILQGVRVEMIENGFNVPFRVNSFG